ncbi:MAG: molybdopterin molybdotransferase [Limisphaerales bacterium]|jgi:molybdopterin molybdotransferase
MISFEAAQQIVHAHVGDFGSEQIPLSRGLKRVLKENWYADRDMPPYDRITMDGIAINYAAWEAGIRNFNIEGVAAAGAPKFTLQNGQSALEVMTGAMLPKGTDTIIRYEDVLLENGIARIQVEQVRQGQNIHNKGLDRKAGELIVPSGVLLSASEIGVGASLGKHQIKVARFPRTIILSTGDELVEIDKQPEAYQIRRSNVYRMAATLEAAGVSVDTAHLMDDPQLIRTKIKELLEEYELIVLSGGVSKGKFDYLPEALEACGVEKHFHRVAQRPGKPFWFGTHPKATVFAMPGNPVSSFMCTQIYLMDWLFSSLGIPAGPKYFAECTLDYPFKPALTYFLESKIDCAVDGKLLATPQPGNGSGDLANLLKGDAFMCLSPDKDAFEKGSSYPLYYYR